MSDDGANAIELSQLWQFIHPGYSRPADADGEEPSEEEEEDEEVLLAAAAKDAYTGARPADYVKLSKRAPRLGALMRYLNDMEDDEELQQALLERDPVTQQTLLQWAALAGHYMLVEYLVKRLRRGAFGFDPESPDVVVYDRWIEMRPELPSAAEVAERQRQREQERAERAAAAAAANDDDDEEEEEEEEENEPTPEELVHEQLEEFHGEWGARGVGIVKRIGELGVYAGARLRDGTKQGLGQSLYPSGDCYAGEYRENQRSGAGVYWWSATAQLYCGEWRHNSRQGYGRMVYADGSRYLGGWEANAKHGRGRYVYPDGSSYDGEWRRSERHGSGVYCFTDGSCFSGSFYRGAFVSGEWRLASGRVKYVGNFVDDAPVGAGVFVHRCGAREGTFQQEGSYHRRGGGGGEEASSAAAAAVSWIPSTLKGSSRVAPRLELVLPQQARHPRVPIEFSADCNGRTMADLLRAANYGPLQRWARALPPAAVELRLLQVCAMRYHARDPTRVVEVRVRPSLSDAEGRRPALQGVDEVVLKEPAVRLLVLLEEQGREGAEGEGVVLVERSLQAVCGDDGHRQLRLPSVDLGASADDTDESGGGSSSSSKQKSGDLLGGRFARTVGPALRLDLRRGSTRELIAPLRLNPLTTNATESVLLYAQAMHPDAFTAMEAKLASLNHEGSFVAYEALPLHRVLELSSDAVTVIAASSVAQRQRAQTLPLGTALPQRPPTPLPPAPEPRPDLQPLYDAKAARDAAEAEEEEQD